MEELRAETARLGRELAARGFVLATAESCTGGLIAGALTEAPGSSAWFAGGVVAYANQFKSGLLGVSPELIEAHGAVSEPVVRAMAKGALRLAPQTLHVHMSVAVSGVAGPTGGTPEKPVGTVWLAWRLEGRVLAERRWFAGDRATVRQHTVNAAVVGCLKLLESLP